MSPKYIKRKENGDTAFKSSPSELSHKKGIKRRGGPVKKGAEIFTNIVPAPKFAGVGAMEDYYD